MKILYASLRPPYPFFIGGAARSAHNMLTVLANNLGCDCLAVGARDFKPELWSLPEQDTHAQLNIRSVSESEGVVELDCGYPVRLVGAFPDSLELTIKDWKPDVIWTQLDGIEQIASIGLDAKTPTIVFLRDAEDPVASIKAIARSGAAVICNSRFMADRVRKLTGTIPHVIYPSFDPYNGSPAAQDGFITMINPHRVKGIETLLKIAAKLPDQRFLIVESWPLGADDKRLLLEAIAKLGNIEYSDRVPNIEGIYRQTKLLLVPSVWEEAFGRVVIEAESCGIPVIASARGGLPEAVGKGGICIDDYLDADEWAKEIRSLLSDPQRYESISSAARRHARSDLFSTHHAAQSFLNFSTELIQSGGPESAQGFNLRDMFMKLVRRTSRR